MTFRSTDERNRRARQLGLTVLATGSLALVASGAITTALAVRQDTSARLNALSQIATARHNATRESERQRLLSRSLDAAGVQNLKLSHVLEDLAWASATKAPDARIEALHWEHGHMAVEVRGDVAPFLSSDRTVLKAPKSLRPRVWLWGVEPKGQLP